MTSDDVMTRCEEHDDFVNYVRQAGITYWVRNL